MEASGLYLGIARCQGCVPFSIDVLILNTTKPEDNRDPRYVFLPWLPLVFHHVTSLVTVALGFFHRPGKRSAAEAQFLFPLHLPRRYGTGPYHGADGQMSLGGWGVQPRKTAWASLPVGTPRGRLPTHPGYGGGAVRRFSWTRKPTRSSRVTDGALESIALAFWPGKHPRPVGRNPGPHNSTMPMEPRPKDKRTGRTRITCSGLCGTARVPLPSTAARGARVARRRSGCDGVGSSRAGNPYLAALFAWLNRVREFAASHATHSSKPATHHLLLPGRSFVVAVVRVL